MKLNIIITCEHAGNSVPECYSHLFLGLQEILESHRGWDPGALEVASFLSEKLTAPLFKCEATRLLVEPNRSISSELLFSEYSQRLTALEREEVLQRHYYDHRNAVEAVIRKSPKKVLHLSIHTFTPIWDGTTRRVDLGLLFDPARKGEAEFCEHYLSEIRQSLPSFCIEFNEPYKGIDDGFTTYLRTIFSDEDYMGIELEINQKYSGKKEWEMISRSLSDALIKILDDSTLS